MFLHQTTTPLSASQLGGRCILSCSYIKPQLPSKTEERGRVVYYHVPTSNHNLFTLEFDTKLVVYYHVPTSNHNL